MADYYCHSFGSTVRVSLRWLRRTGGVHFWENSHQFAVATR